MKRLALLFTLTLLCLAYAPAQDTAGQLTLLYDTSYDMQDKDFAAELQFLDSYFNQNPEVKVRFIAFSNTVIQEGNYTIPEEIGTYCEESWNKAFMTVREIMKTYSTESILM